MANNQDQIIGKECRFAVHCGKPDGEEIDLHLVKEATHYPDGRIEPTIRLVKDYQRIFGITNKAHQNHQQKKEWEDLNKVKIFKSTQSDLAKNIARALGRHGARLDVRKLAESPYLYGADILSTAIIKRAYKDKFPELNSAYSVAVLDIETDVLRGTDEIIMCSVTFKDKAITGVLKRFVEGYANPIQRIKELGKKYLGPYFDKRKIDWEIVLCDTPAECAQVCINRTHKWKPDFLAIWNMDFDIPEILKSFENEKIDPALVFSDPSVPPAYKFFRYKQGRSQKVTAAGKVTPIKVADRWHTVFTPASFYVIDPMCVYRKLRVAKGEEPSYSLDAILDKILGIRKLGFAEADHVAGTGHSLQWHQFMQKNYPLEYVVYNLFDCVSVEELDEKTTDLQIALPGGCEYSDFETFKSQPRRVVDNLHFDLLGDGKIIGTTSDEMTDDIDDVTIGVNEWIVTLPAHTVANNGLRLILEFPDMRTNFRGHVGDLDVSASYPNGECVFNVAKETTKRELIKIEGIPEHIQRSQGVNMSGGHTNAVEICCELFGMPDLDTMLEAFEDELEQSERLAA